MLLINLPLLPSPTESSVTSKRVSGVGAGGYLGGEIRQYFVRPYLEKSQHRKGLVEWWSGRVAQGIGPEFKPQYHKICTYIYIYIFFFFSEV
jgi:hypothetical protein